MTLGGSSSARTRLLRDLAEEEVDGAEALRLLSETRNTEPARVSALVAQRARDARQVETVARIASLVQSFPYVVDPPGSLDTVCSLATLARRGGDCEDKAKGVVVLAKTAGIPADFLWMVQGGEYDHVTALVRLDGAGWCYVETTLRAYVGENPYRAAARLDGRQRLGLEV